MRYADSTLIFTGAYRLQATKKCPHCNGEGVYYHATAQMSSGVTVVCECVPDRASAVRKFFRDRSYEIASAIGILLGILFWGWTAILWWRWLHTL